MRLLTTSETKCHLSCARNHYYRYVLLARVVQSTESLRFGSLFHSALEAWWKPSDNPLDTALASIAESDADEFTRVIAEELMRGYDARWGAEPYEVLAVEAQFECELINPGTGFASRTYRRGGKIDSIVRDLRDGRELIVEHKTSSEDISQGSDYWRRLLIDSQVSNYFVGGRSLGHDVSGCLYDVIKKPTMRPYKATPVESRKYTKDGRLYANQRENDETPEEFRLRLRADIAENPDKYFQRAEVSRLEFDDTEAAHDMWDAAKLIRNAEVTKRYPRTGVYTGACSKWGRTCEYFDVCTGQASIDDPTRFRIAESAHEELEESSHAAQ